MRTSLVVLKKEKTTDGAIEHRFSFALSPFFTFHCREIPRACLIFVHGCFRWLFR
ncbi:hypothetical protein HanRHA438_Chr00c76g0862761 [Helianthus annuus]|nr:hypothetical protein HanRHA438_Chr05g0205461 [Helianthus annuus]KAJ0953452.1 hypothetical protein HanRHA438_Chr00c76g0862761 [Helianthus annuus]